MTMAMVHSKRTWFEVLLKETELLNCYWRKSYETVNSREGLGTVDLYCSSSTSVPTNPHSFGNTSLRWIRPRVS
jgi:hypothetical protein